MNLLLDIPVVLTHGPQDWMAWSRLGTCMLTESSFAELQYLTQRATEPQTEQAARAFLRAYPDSLWQVSDLRLPHPALQAKAGQALSKRARLVLELGQCAYGLAQQQPNQLVIVVSQAQPLVDRIQSLKVMNLTAISGPALRQWTRFGDLPETVTAAQSRLAQRGIVSPTGSELPSGVASSDSPALPMNPPRPTISQQSPALAPASTPAVKRPSPPLTQSARASRSPYPSALVQVGQLGMALLALIVLGGLSLKLVAPEKFDQVWQELVNLSNVTAQ